MNETDERISEETIFVEDPTNFDVTVNPKTGHARYGYSFSGTEGVLAEIDELLVEDDLDFIQELQPIQETGQKNRNKNKSFYEKSERQQSQIIGSFIERANTVTLNVGELRQMSLADLSRNAFQWGAPKTRLSMMRPKEVITPKILEYEEFKNETIENDEI